MRGSEQYLNDQMDLDVEMANGGVTSAHCGGGTEFGRKASLNALPFELIEMILNNEVFTRTDYANLAQVSRIFPQFSASRLYPEYVLQFRGGMMVPITYERLLRPDNPGRKEVRRLRVVQIDNTAPDMANPWRALGSPGSPFHATARQLCELACTMVVSVLRQLDYNTLQEFTWDLPIPLSPTLQHYLEVHQPNLEILKVQHALHLSQWQPDIPLLPRMNNLTQLSLPPRQSHTLNPHVAELLRRSSRIHTLEFDQCEYHYKVHESFEEDMRHAPNHDHTRSVWIELARLHRAELEESKWHIPGKFTGDQVDDLIRSKFSELHTLHLREFSVYNLCEVLPMENLRTLTLIDPPDIYDLFNCWDPEQRRLQTFTLIIRNLSRGEDILTLMTAIEDFLLSFTGLHSLRFINEMAHRCIRSQREPVLQTDVMANHCETLETLVLASKGREGGSRTVYPLPLDRLLEYTTQLPRMKRLGIPVGYETLESSIDLLGQVAPNVEWLAVANHNERRWNVNLMEEFARKIWKAAGVEGRLKVLVLGGEVKYKPHYFLVQTGEDGERDIKFVGREKEGREAVEKAVGGGGGVDTVIW